MPETITHPPGREYKTDQLGELLQFDLGERERPLSTLYNPSVPFVDDGRWLMMARHEDVDSELSETVVLDMEGRRIVDGAPVFPLMQDPYYLGRFDDGRGGQCHVIGGVHITHDDEDKITGWQDKFYCFDHSIMELASRDGTAPVPFAEGAARHKDTRFIQTGSGILVMPRPQGAKFGGAGSIGCFKTRNLSTLQADMDRYFAAQDPSTLIDGVFVPGQWGGANQLRLLPGGNVGVVGHAAEVRDGKRNYWSIAFEIDPHAMRLVGEAETIATADDFPYVEPKPMQPPLGSVVFTSGTLPCRDGTGEEWIFAGLGDRAIGCRRIPPIRGWEAQYSVAA